MSLTLVPRRSREVEPQASPIFHLWIALVAAAWLSLEYVVLGPLSWMYGYGAGLETIPVHLALAKTGSLFSLWAPAVAGGLDRLSFWGNADPFNFEPLLFSTLPTWLANGLHVFLQRFVAIYFTARVAAEQLAVDRCWSMVAGLLHGGLSYFTVGDMIALPGVPLAIWLLPRLASLRAWPVMAVLAGLAFSMLTAFAPATPYLALFAIVWFALVVRERSTRPWATLMLFLLGLGAGDTPQLVAALHNAPFSHRAGLRPEGVTLSVDGLVYHQMQFDFLDQDKALRVVANRLPWLVFAAGAGVAWSRRSTDPAARAFLRVALVIALLSLKVVYLTVQSAVAVWLPWISGLNMGRFFTIPASFLFSLGVAGGVRVVVEAVRMTGWARRGLLIVGAALLTFTYVWPKVSLFYPLMVDGWGEKNYQVRALDDLRRRDTSLFRVASVLPLQPAFAYGQGLETADGWANLYPAVYRELWLRVLQPLFENLPGNRQIFDPPDGRPQDHYIFLGTGNLAGGLGLLPGEAALTEGFDLARRFNLDLLSMLNVKYLLSEYPLRGPGLRLVHSPDDPPRALRSRDHATGLINEPERRQRLSSRLPRALHDAREAITGKRRGKDIYIYENLNALPRYRLVSRLEIVASGSEALARLGRMTAAELAATAVLEVQSGPADPPSSLGSGTVAIAGYEPDRIDLEVDAVGPAFLVAATTWNPFWMAAVDGAPRDVRRVNHAQLGLELARGERHVSLRYEPPYAPTALCRRLAGWFRW